MSTHIKTLIALAGIMVGIIVSEKTIYGTEVALVCLLLGVVQMGLSFFESYQEKKSRESSDTKNEEILKNNTHHFSIPLASGIFCIAVFLILVRVQFTEEKNSFVCETACEFRATVVSSPNIKDEYQIFSVQPEVSGNVSDVYDIQIKTPLYPKYEVGDELHITGKVAPPYVSMPHEGKKTFEYDKYLRLHSIGSEMFYPKIEQVDSGRSTISMVTRLERLKENFVERISKNVNEPGASLASGMLFGASSMSSELVQTFRVAGISHIVVLSGFNIAILISFVLLVFALVPLFIRVLLASILVILFVLMVGGEASIIRATCMSFIALFALLVGRAYVARQALILSLIAIILYEPHNILYDVSLHLSFLATAGIVYLSDGIKSILHKVSSATYKEIITTTFAAYIATLPYVMYTFGTVAIYALITNILVLPLVPIAMLITFFVVVSSYISHTLAVLIGYIDTLLTGIIIGVARITEQLPGSSIAVSFSFWMMIFLYVMILVGCVSLTVWMRKKKHDETLLTKNDEIWSGVISY